MADSLHDGANTAPVPVHPPIHRDVVCSFDGPADPILRLILLAMAHETHYEDKFAVVSRIADIVERTALCERVVRDRLQRAAVVGWLIAEGSRNRRRYKLSLPYRLARSISEEQRRERRRERVALRKEIKQTQQLLDATRLR